MKQSREHPVDLANPVQQRNRQDQHDLQDSQKLTELNVPI